MQPKPDAYRPQSNLTRETHLGDRMIRPPMRRPIQIAGVSPCAECTKGTGQESVQSCVPRWCAWATVVAGTGPGCPRALSQFWPLILPKRIHLGLHFEWEVLLARPNKNAPKYSGKWGCVNSRFHLRNGFTSALCQPCVGCVVARESQRCRAVQRTIHSHFSMPSRLGKGAA